MSSLRPQKRYVIMHAENAHGHPYRLNPLQNPMVYSDRDIRFNPGVYWRKGGVFITKKGAEDYARDNCIQNTYRIVEVDRRKE